MSKLKAKKNRTVALLLLICVFPTFFSGCWSYQEVDETGFILFLGLDRGVENKLTWSAQVAKPRVIVGAAGGNGGMSSPENDVQSIVNVSVEAPTFTAAMTMMNIFLDRRLSLKHLKVIVFSEELAREGMMTYLGVMGRYPEFRRSVIVAVCRGITARELLENNNRVLEVNPAKHAEMVTAFSQFTGFIPAQPQFHYFYNDAKADDADPVCLMVGLRRETPQGEGPPVTGEEWISEGAYYAGELPRSGGNNVEIIGAAVFQNDRYVGDINGDQMTGLMLIRGTFNETNLSIEDPFDPSKMLAFNLTAYRSPQFQVDLSGPVPRIHVIVRLEGTLLGSQNLSVGFEEESNRLILEAIINQQLEGFMADIIDRAQNEFQADILHLGKIVKHKFLTIQQWREYDWLGTQFPQAIITAEARTRIRYFGLLHETAPLATR